jgi:hypothetical protein
MDSGVIRFSLTDDHEGDNILLHNSGDGISVSIYQQNQLLSEVLSVEIYTQSKVFNGQVACPIGYRLLDLFNNDEPAEGDIPEDFIELVNASSTISYHDQLKEYIRKSSIHLIAVTDSEQGRGLGAQNSLKTYPFIGKSTRQVNIEMQYYSISGTAYICQGQTMKDLINERTLFLPLTSVTIGRESHFYGNRPFCIINKKQIISLSEM